MMEDLVEEEVQEEVLLLLHLIGPRAQGSSHDLAGDVDSWASAVSVEDWQFEHGAI